MHRGRPLSNRLGRNHISAGYSSILGRESNCTCRAPILRTVLTSRTLHPTRLPSEGMRNGVIASLLVVAILVGAGAAYITGIASERTITSLTTRTITLTSSTASGVFIEEVIVQPEVINEICVGGAFNETTTYLLSVAGNNQTASTVTTETLTAVSTVTVYENVTIVSGGSTCTEINPYYNVTQTPVCGPCA